VLRIKLQLDSAGLDLLLQLCDGIGRKSSGRHRENKNACKKAT